MNSTDFGPPPKLPMAPWLSSSEGNDFTDRVRSAASEAAKASREGKREERFVAHGANEQKKPNRRTWDWIEYDLFRGRLSEWEKALVDGPVDVPTPRGIPPVFFAFECIFSPLYKGSLDVWKETIDAVHTGPRDLCTTQYEPPSATANRKLNVLEHLMVPYDLGGDRKYRPDALFAIVSHFVRYHPDLVRSSVYPERFIQTGILNSFSASLPGWKPTQGTYGGKSVSCTEKEQ
jgi:hypothetical protein